MSPTSIEIENTRIQVCEELYKLYRCWGKRKFPQQIIRFEVFNRLLKQNKEFNYSETKYKVWGEVCILSAQTPQLIYKE